MNKRASDFLNVFSKGLKRCCCCCDGMWKSFHKDFVQIIGMLMLVITLMKRRWILYCTYLLIPLFGLTVLAIMNEVTVKYLKKNLDEAIRKDNPFGSPHDVFLETFTLNELQNYFSSTIRKGKEVSTIPTNVMYTSSELTESELKTFFDNGFFDLDLIFFPHLNDTKSGSQLLFMRNEEDIDDLYFQSMYNEEHNEETWNQYLGSLTVDELSSSELSFTVEYEQKIDRNTIKSSTVQSAILALKNNYTTETSFCNLIGIFGHTFECENLLSSFLIHLVTSSYIMRETNTVTKMRVGQLPHHSEGFDFDANMADIQVKYWIPMLLCSVLSLYLYSIISDKENGSRSLMDIVGLRVRNYYFAKYLFFFLYYMFYAALFYVFGLYVLAPRVFTQTNFFLVWIIFIGAGLQTISFTFLFSAFFKSTTTALVPGYIVVYLLNGFLGDFRENTIKPGEWWWKALIFVYPYAFIDSVFTLIYPIEVNRIKIGFDFVLNIDFILPTLGMYVTAVLYFVLYLYFEKVIPQNFTVRKGYCFCCSSLWKCLCWNFCCCKGVVEGYSILNKTRKMLEKEDLLNEEEESEEEEIDSEDDSEDVSEEEEEEEELEEGGEEEFQEEEEEEGEGELYEEEVEVRDEEKDDDVERVEREVEEKIEDPSNYGIIVQNLVKRYPGSKINSVDGISFFVPKNSLYGLLGANGAGKTSAIRTLVGELSMTKGSAYVNGKSVKSEIHEIRKDIGICHQHNILWEELSVEEHLFVYARIRGIDFCNQKKHVRKILEQTHLIDECSNPSYFKKRNSNENDDDDDDDNEANKKKKKNGFGTFGYLCCCCFCCLFPCLRCFFKPVRPVRDLSAGTKRKLSLAISLCGDPSTIFLDEPCTGLDHKFEKHIWDIILELKKNKSFVLTTHSMREAEILCDNIGIMKEGRFVATGTGLHLKAKFAKSYRLKIIRMNSSPKERIIQFIHNLVSNASCDEENVIHENNQFISFLNDEEEESTKKKKTEESFEIAKIRVVLDFGASIIWEIRFPSDFLFSRFFEKMELWKDELGIKDWSLNQSSLSDVFVKLIGEEHQMIEMEQRNQELQLELQTLRKYVKQQREEIKIKSKELKKYLEKGDEEIEGEVTEEEEEIIGISDDEKIKKKDKVDPKKTEIKQKRSLTRTSQDDDDKGRESILEDNYFLIFISQFYILFKKEVILAYRNPFRTLIMMLFSSIVIAQVAVTIWLGTFADSKMYYTKDLPFETLLGQECYSWVEEPCYHFVYTTNGHPKGDEIIEYFEERVEEDFEDIQLSKFGFNDTLMLTTWVENHPNSTYHGIIIEAESKTILLNDTAGPTEYDYIEYTILHNQTSLDKPENDLLRSSTGYIQGILDEAILWVYSNYKNYKVKIRRRQAPRFPLKEKHNVNDLFNQTAPVFFVLGFCFISVFSSRTFVKMKEIGFNRHLIKVGVSRLALYMSYATYYTLLSFLNSVIAQIVNILFSLDYVVHTNFFVIFLLFFLFSMAVLSCTGVFFPFLQKDRDSLALSTLLVLFFMFTSMLTTPAIVYSMYEAASGFGVLFMYFIVPALHPGMNFAKILADISFKTLPVFDYQTKEYRENVGYTFSDLFEEKNSFDELSLETGATIYWVLFLLVNCIVNITLGLVFYACVESHYYRIEMLWKWLCEWPHDETVRRKETLWHEITMKKRKTWRLDDTKVVLENLSKSYVSVSVPSLQVRPVLKDISLSIPKNQLFGILGGNGVGKTTLINMICGSIKISDGEIYINREAESNNRFLQVKKNIGKIRRELGTVPQNDVFIKKLRSNEMLEILGLCKGIKWRWLHSKIRQILLKVGLNGDNSNFVGNYSGGMKRKLSIAMALIGDPRLVLLDEPTTGIDVYSCFQIWKLFYEIKKHHTIILTSHKMAETELLSDQIGILHDGDFKVKGEPLKILKERAGTGYVLEVILKNEKDKEKMDDMIKISRSQQFIIKDDEEEEDEEEVVHLIQQSGKELTYSITSKEVLMNILDSIEKLRKDRLEDDQFIQTFGISRCTLESVYIDATSV